MIAAFPINAPKYLVYAMLDAPHADASTHGYTTGGWTAGPVVRTVISRVAPMMGLLPAPPEELQAEEAQVALPLRPTRPPIAVADPTYEPAKKPVERSEEKRRDVIVPAALPRRGTDERWQRQASLDGARVVPTAAETSVAGH